MGLSFYPYLLLSFSILLPFFFLLFSSFFFFFLLFSSFFFFFLLFSSFFPKNFGLFGSRSCDNLSSVDEMLPPRELFWTDKNEVFELFDLSLVTLALASSRTFGTMTFR